MQNDQSDYIKELQCKIITLEQEVDQLKNLNKNQAKYIHNNLKSYGQTKYDPFVTEESNSSDGYVYQRIYDPYTKKERILVKSTPQSGQYYVSDNTNPF